MGFVDVDWAESIEDNRSTSRYCIKIWGNLVTWRSKKTKCGSSKQCRDRVTSYIAQGVCEIIWLEKLMEDLKIPITTPTRSYNDSKSAIGIVNNPVQHDQMKHVRIDQHFVK